MYTATSDPMAEQGLSLYESALKQILEPRENGKYVAIHVETGEYDTARNSPEARRLLRQRQPVGYIVTRRIGSEPDYALAARLLAGEMTHGASK